VKIVSVVGARPNFMKIAPFDAAIKEYNVHLDSVNDQIEHVIIHTGQHYDNRMNGSFFNDLNISSPKINLGIGSGSHAEQVGKTMMAFEKVLRNEKPDWVVVVGDVNATLACSVTAKKENIRCCHIEAGLRSGDITMPEEVNRLVTDRICDLLLTPDQISSENLRHEGVSEKQIRFVGNIMIDTLEINREKATILKIKDILEKNYIENVEYKGLYDYNKLNQFAIVTLHRPSNVDDRNVLSSLFNFLVDEVAAHRILIWPIHPRTLKQLKAFNIWEKAKSSRNLIMIHPLGYLEMLRLNMAAAIMLTDSGGLQEECSILGTPCLTMRWNTERPITLRENGGASILVGNKIDTIKKTFRQAIQMSRTPCRPELWDGHTAERCLKAILDY